MKTDYAILLDNCVRAVSEAEWRAWIEGHQAEIVVGLQTIGENLLIGRFVGRRDFFTPGWFRVSMGRSYVADRWSDTWEQAEKDFRELEAALWDRR